jgi:lysophospholipase L1-like esterase
MKPGTIAALVIAVVIGLPVGFLLLLSDDANCGAGGGGPAPSAEAANGIPANYLELYQAAGQRYGIPWNLVAAIGSVETDHGRSNLPGVSSGENSAGAGGPMQFLQPTFDQYGVDGNGDGQKSRYDPRDAIPSAANYLKASGAPGDLHRAIYAYNHSEAYVQTVLAKMRTYAGSAPAGAAASAGTTSTPISPPTATAPATSGPVLNLGDSLAVGSGTPLEGLLTGRTVTTLAARDRTSAQGLSILRGVSSVPSTIVVQLGTNDTSVATFRASVLSVLAIARRESATVLWVNVARPPLSGTTDTQLNAVLTDAAATHPNLRIVDWKAAVAGGRVNLADDVHPTAAGYAVRAQLISDAVAGAGVADTSVAGSCEDLGGLTGSGDGSFTIAPDANLPGKPLTPVMAAFVGRMATFYDGRIIVTTGTNHDQFTTSGNVSDHYTGNAVDISMAANGGTDDGPVGDAIAASAFMAAGVPRDEAIRRGRAGGAQTVVVNGRSIQIIWKSDVGGNHHNHVHVGIGG